MVNKQTRSDAIAKSALSAIANGNVEPETARQMILDEASEAIHGERNLNYGNPENNFTGIANLWNAYWSAKHSVSLRTMFNSHDVAMLMILMKSARLATNRNHRDSCVDIAGYAACLGDIQAAASSFYGAGQLGHDIADSMAKINAEFQQNQANSSIAQEMNKSTANVMTQAEKNQQNQINSDKLKGTSRPKLY